MNKIKEEVSYSELARRVGDCVLANMVRSELGGDYEFDLFNGEQDYCVKHESRDECNKDSDNCEFESYETYQDYIITQSGAEYLQRNTNEIVYFCEKLDIYIWAITHFGTGWSGVFTNLITKEE